jgi:heptosyltransferase-3
MVPDPVPLAELGRVLVIKLRHHGDVLLSSPVFSVLKAAAPQLEIDALVYADTAPMLEDHPAITQIHRIGREWKLEGKISQLTAEWRLLQTLKARRYDLIIHLTEHRRGATLARMLKPRFAVAPRVAGRGADWQNHFTHLFAAPANARRHMVERNLDALRRIGIYPAAAARRVTLVPGAAATARIDALLAEHRLPAGRFVHLHPASRWLFKCWTAAGWAALIDALHADGHAIAITCAPDAAERALVDAARALTAAPVLDLGGQLNLRELAALAAQARLFVGVDSAPMHIAAAMDTPAIALFGPSGELEWGPWGTPRHGRHVVVASTAHPCRPCGIDGCGGGKVSDCLVSLTPEQVLAPIREILAA